jgi:lipopolysaccharide export LptBFGC system permease protein LptF
LISEVTTTARQKAKGLSSKYALVNPLTSALNQFENAPGYRAFATVESSKSAASLNDLWLFRASNKKGAPTLMYASALRPSGKGAIATGMSLISYASAKDPEDFEILTFESAEKSILSLEPLYAFFSSDRGHQTLGSLPLKALTYSTFSISAKTYEVLRRVLFAFAPFVLFFLGLCLTIGGPRSGPNLLQRLLVLSSAVLFFVGLIISKSINVPLISLGVYLQALFCVAITLHKYKKGLL